MRPEGANGWTGSMQMTKEGASVLIEDNSKNLRPSATLENAPALFGKDPLNTVLTTELIVLNCKEKGLYRNPICNDILYLHGKGFERIAPTAFEPYTNVKVLWLEGNGLSTLPCGAPLVQVQPPKKPKYTLSGCTSDDSSDEGSAGGQEVSQDQILIRKCERKSNSVQRTDATEEIPPTSVVSGNQGDGSHSVKTHHVDPNSKISLANTSSADTGKCPSMCVKQLPHIVDIPEAHRDGFSSLYPKVRQLYLHNNVFREMPDLSRFERLDTVNLSNNFFSRVRPCCPFWEERTRQHREDKQTDAALVLSFSKSAQKEVQERMEAHLDEGCDATSAVEMSPAQGRGSEEKLALSPSEAPSDRDALLNSYRLRVEVFSRYCPHKALCSLASQGRLPEHPPVSERNPCSSLRTLNLSGNCIESFEDIVPLLCYKALAHLDLSENRLQDGPALLLVLERLPMLTSLKLFKNPLVGTLPHYRKTVIARCKGLLYLDDRPVFPEERRLVNAWAIGGQDGEAKERAKIKQENEREQTKRLEEFRKVIQKSIVDSGRVIHPHTAFLSAVGESGRGNSEPFRGDATNGVDSSATSSEEDEEVSGCQGTTQQGRGLGAVARDGHHFISGTEAAARQPQQEQLRVLSRNGNTNTAVPAAADDDDQTDVYIPQ